MEQTMQFNRQALRAWRAVRGLTGAELAEKAGMRSQGHIASLESGRRQPSWPAIEALAAALSIPPDVLVGHVNANAATWPYKSGRRSDKAAA